MAHVVVLGLVLTLVAGVVSFAVLVRKIQARPSRLPRSIPTPLLLYNLWIAAWLASQYLRFYVYPSLAKPVANQIGGAFGIGMAFLVLAWLRAHVVLIDQFLESRESRLARRIVAWFTWAAMALVVIGWALWVANHAWMLVAEIASALTSTLLFPAALAASVLFAVRARRHHDAAVRRALTALGYAYVALFALLAVLVLVFWTFALAAPPVLLAADLLLELAYNAVTVVWVARYADAFAEELHAEADLTAGFAALCASFGITAREREIVELICQGLTNREIANRLFISVGTVKDHNYTIFQKAGVRNRTKLAQMFSRPGLQIQQAHAAANIRRVI